MKRVISVRVGHKRGLPIPAQHRSSATSRVTACRLTSAPNSGRLAPVRPTFPGRLPARGLARPRMAGSVSFLQELIRIPPIGRRHRNASPIASISRSAEGISAVLRSGISGWRGRALCRLAGGSGAARRIGLDLWVAPAILL